MFLQFKTPWGTHGTGGMVYRHAHAAYMALNVLNTHNYTGAEIACKELQVTM